MTETTVPTARSPLVVEKKLSPLNSSRTKLSYNLSKAEFYGAHSNKLNVEVRGDDLKFTRVKKPKDPNKPNSRIWTSLPSEPIPLRLTFVPQERGPIFYIDIDDLEFKLIFVLSFQPFLEMMLTTIQNQKSKENELTIPMLSFFTPIPESSTRLPFTSKLDCVSPMTGNLQFKRLDLPRLRSILQPSVRSFMEKRLSSLRS